MKLRVHGEKKDKETTLKLREDSDGTVSLIVVDDKGERVDKGTLLVISSKGFYLSTCVGDFGIKTTDTKIAVEN